MQTGPVSEDLSRAIRDAQALAAVGIRDNWTCARCGERGWDIAHILPKGRYPELKYETKNMLVLCRKCHKETENVAGRRELLALMQDQWGYEYPEPQYRGYLEGGNESEDRVYDEAD